MAAVYFHEDQYFRGSWLWGALLAIPLVAAVVALTTTPRMSLLAVLVTIVVAALVAALFAFTRLETAVDADQVVIHFHGLWPTRRIRVAEIAEVESRRYSIWESGGWGVHLTLRGMAYNVSGNEGVILGLRDGRRVLIGSQRADELASAIRKAMTARA